jgi:acyl-phosphate glycerol 3-phosphate acyltransferase
VAFVLFAYLIGSLSFGVILGYLLKGEDIRHSDLPGGSGAFRRLGPGWGVAVALLDAAKGAPVGVLARGHPELAPYLAAAVVAGHCWPVYFGFRGGGGIAPTVGFFLVWAPGEVLLAVAFGLLVAAVYHLLYWRRRRRGSTRSRWGRSRRCRCSFTCSKTTPPPSPRPSGPGWRWR